MKKVLFFLFLLPCFVFADISQDCIGAATLKLFDVRRTRPITVEVWYPVDSSTDVDTTASTYWNSVWVSPREMRGAPVAYSFRKFPLILMSHGSGGDRRAHSWFADSLVKKGFIVASVEHFGNTWYQNSPEFFLKPWDRPLDITFTIDRLLGDATFGHHIDRDKIGFSGYSLGGMTGIWIAGGKLMDFENASSHFSCSELPKTVMQRLLDKIDFKESMLSFRDTRVKAILTMAPAAWGFSTESLQKIDTPVCILATEGDEVLPIESHALYLANNIPRAKFTVFHGRAGHFVFFNQPTEFGKGVLQEWLIGDDDTVDRKAIHDKTSQVAVDFFQETFGLK